MIEFKGLTQAHFDTYAPEKWSSMVHNLARMKNKDVVASLCTTAGKELATELTGLLQTNSDEIPNITNQKKVDSQWVYWFRDQEERKNLKSFLEKTLLTQKDIFNIAPQDKHITLAVILRHADIWIGVRIPAGATVDRRNLMAKLDKSWEREKFLELLQELPEGAHLGFGDELTPTGSWDLPGLALHGEAGRATEETWTLGISVPREDALSLGVDLADLVHRWSGALVPFYRFAAWNRDNDFIDVNKKIQAEKSQKRHQAKSFAEGDKVRVTAGLFSGQVGFIEEIDTKGKTKVRVGKMSVQIPGEDLIPLK